MDTITVIENTVAEETKLESDVAELALSDLDFIAGGAIIGSLY